MGYISNVMNKRPIKFANSTVAGVFESYPLPVKEKLLFLRQLIFSVAAEAEGVGQIEESLKWGQPSYATLRPKSGSPIRIDQIKSQVGQYAMYFHCQTTLVDAFREIYTNDFRFEGNRSIIFQCENEIPIQSLRHCVSMALTYHLNTKRKF